MSSDILSERTMPLFEGNTRLLVVPAGLVFVLSIKYFPFKMSRVVGHMSERDLHVLGTSSMFLFMQFMKVMLAILLLFSVNGSAEEGSSALTLDTPLDFARTADRGLMYTFITTTLITWGAQVEVSRVIYNACGRKMWLHVINFLLATVVFLWNVADLYYCRGEAHPTLEYYLALLTSGQYLHGIVDGLTFMTLLSFRWFGNEERKRRARGLLLISALWYWIFQFAKRCALNSDTWTEMWEGHERLEWVWQLALYEFVGNAYVVYFFLMARCEPRADDDTVIKEVDVEQAAGSDGDVALKQLKDSDA